MSRPPPPRRLVIAAGSKEGRYFHFARQYAASLKRHQIELEVRETKGSGENLELLTAPDGEVSIGLVQGGVADPEKHGELLALGSLYHEPFWIFVRSELEVSRLSQLAGRKVAIGSPGSGTRRIALQLLDATGVSESRVTLSAEGGETAAKMLESGKIDAACFVAAADAGYVQRLGRATGVKLVSLDQQQALSRRFRHLSPVTIPEGLLDLAGNSPPADVALVSPTAMLVVRPTLHPALINVLLEAAYTAHGSGDALSAAGEFPSAVSLDLPLSPDAQRYYKNGPPLLQRLLPFWLAAFIDRIELLALPLLMLGMPLVRMAPPLLRWRTRRKIYLWYGQIRQIDHLLFLGMSRETARESLTELQELENQVSQVEIPLSYMDEYYNLRMHLNLVRKRIDAIVGLNPDSDSA